MAQQIGPPDAVFDIRFAPGDRPHVLGGHQDHGVAALLQDSEHGPPEDTGRLQGHPLHLLLRQPRAQELQRRRHRADGAHLLVHRPIGLRRQHTGHHHLLMDVHATAPLIHHVHARPPSLSASSLAAHARARGRVPEDNTFPPRAHRGDDGTTLLLLDTPGVNLVCGLRAPATFSTCHPRARSHYAPFPCPSLPARVAPQGTVVTRRPPWRVPWRGAAAPN